MAASLLGTFGATDGTGALTSGSRTSVSGSLIVAHSAVWATVSTTTVPTPSDSKTNTYTEHLENGNGAGSSWVDGSLASNNGGTRGASHTISLADANVQSLSGSEWSGVEASPTIASNSATGSSTTPSVSVTPASASLLVAVEVPDYGISGPPTMSVSNGTEIIEADEDNTNQAHGAAYKLSASGATTIAWSNSHTGNWVAIGVSWTEVVTAGAFRSRIAGGFVLTGG